MPFIVTSRMYRRLEAEYPCCYLMPHCVRLAAVRDVEIDQAVVRWIEQYEFGVQIVSLSNDEDSRLAAHIEQLLRQQLEGESAADARRQASRLLKVCV